MPTLPSVSPERALPAAVSRWRMLFVAGVVVQCVVLYVPQAPSTGGLPIDKVVHAVIFGGVMWLGAKAAVPLAPLGVLLGLHAVASELIQHFVLPGRSGDPVDAVADVTGVVIVTLFVRSRGARAS